jgi:hypothetical protein
MARLASRSETVVLDPSRASTLHHKRVTPSDSTAARDEARRLWWSLVGGVVLALFACAWIYAQPGPVTLGGDAEMLQHPLLTDAVRQLRDAKLPVWTAGRWGGSPLIGDPVIGALYPPYYLSYFLTPFPHWRALDLSTAVHLMILVTGMVCFLSRLGVGPVAAVATAGMVAVSPTFVYAVRGWQQYWAALAYWPWLFWAAASLARAPSVRPALVAAVALAAQVYAGYPEFSLYSGLPALAWIVLAPGGARRIVLVLTIGVGAIALALPQVLPGLDMAQESIRMGPGSAERMHAVDRYFSVTLVGWLDALRPTPLDPMAPAKVAPAVVLLAALGMLGGGFPRLFLGAVAIVMAFCATRDNPIYQAVRVYPPFSFFGAPLKLFFPMCFTLLALAGLGLARIGGLPLPWQRLIVAVVAGIAALTWGQTPLVTGVLVAGAVLAACAPAPLLPSAAAVIALAGSVGFLIATRTLTVPLPFVPGGYIELLRHSPSARPRDGGRALALRSDPPPAQVGLNFGALWGIEAWNGMADLVQRRQQPVLEGRTPGDAAAFIRQIGADPVVVEAGAVASELAAAGFARIGQLNGLVVLSPPTPPAPRVQLIPRAEAVTPETAIAAARLGRALDDQHVLIEADALPGGTDGDPAGRLEVLERAPGMLRARVTVARPTWLVVREPYYRNWRAAVDGRPAQVYPAGGFLLAMLVDAGTHDVQAAYHERGFLPGVIVAALAVVFLPLALRRALPASHAT